MKIFSRFPIMTIFISVCCLQLVLKNVSHSEIGLYFFSPWIFKPFSFSFWSGSFLYIFGHLNFSHLTGNMLGLLTIGPILENYYGSATLGVMILLNALLASVVHTLIFTGMMIGASGVLFMMIVLIFFISDRPMIPVTIMAILVGLELYSSLTPSGISHFGHIFGAFTGGTFGFIFKKR